MKSIQTRISIVIAVIMIIATTSLMITAMLRNRNVLDSDSDEIMLLAADLYAGDIDDNFISAEQSVGSIYNYAQKRAETYSDFLTDEEERDNFTYDISELGKSTAQNTRGAMAVYLRYNPDDFGPTDGFWYTIDTRNNEWLSAEPTDMSLYDKDDIEHVGWYYIPVAAKKALWMDPYFNQNLGVEMISYIIPYYHDGYTVGILGMDIDMQLLRDAVSKISVYNSGSAFLLSKDGDIIYHKYHKKGAALDSLPDNEQAYFREVMELEKDTVNFRRDSAGMVEKVILKELRNGMILGVSVPRSMIARPQIRLFYQLLFTSLIIIAISILTCILWIRSVIKPLGKMTDVADRYAAGDYSEKLSIDSKDEIGRLSRSLQTMAASLTDQVEVADEANRAKTSFLSNMSHEIRTPINAILGMNEMILRESAEKNTLTYSENIKMAGNTLLGLINDVLDFSKIEAGKIEIIPVDYDLSSVINDLVNMVRVRADEKGLKLIIDIDKEIPKLLNGDEVRIKQIITNMLTNAVKYTEKGSVTFSMGYERDERTSDGIILKVAVSDTGIGIRQEDIGRMFSKFERLDEKRFRNIEGTGLGMSITWSLLEMMGSGLKVKSKYGEGSEFSFELAQKVVKWDELGDYESAYRHNAGKRDNYKSMFTARNARVLMVDDNEMNLLVFKSLVKQTLVRTDTADSGDECLKLCDDIKYDIIFLDHMMPGKDGIETLHELREKGGLNADTPVICLTANAISGAREEYISEGFDDYLTKPIDTDKLEKIMLDMLPAERIDHVETSVDNDDVLEFEAWDDGDLSSDADAPDSRAKKKIEALSGHEMIDTEAGLRNCRYEEVYIEVIETFASTIDDTLKTLRFLKDEGDLKNYAIKVHSLKSTLRTAGCAKVGAKAQLLENAGKAGDRAYVNGNHDDLVSECLKLKEIINSI